MKDVLITGGAGKIGFDLVEKLLETNANVTVLDLESKDSLKRMLKVKDQVKFVFGDIEDTNLVRDLVKRNDIVIDLAGIMPPLANLNDHIANSTNYIGTKNIVDAINEVNNECVLIYPSFISIYGLTTKSKRLITVTSESTYPDDAYSVSIIKSEEYIRSHMKKYAILRLPIVLTRKNYFIDHLSLNRIVDFISKEDLNDILVGIMKSKKIYGKTYNISGGIISSNCLIEKVYSATGSMHLFHRNQYFGEYEDSKAMDNIFRIQYTELDDSLKIMRNEIRPLKRVLKKIINYPKYLIFKHMINNKRKKSSK